jgi:transglutaminase-like putative cysteine protease
MDIEDFIRETKFCDLTSPNIQKIAQEITKSGVSDSEKSESLFYWIKENIKFEFGYWGIKASNVLNRKRGMCTNKANLLIALLRLVKIPAGYGILKVNTKEFYHELMCPIFGKLVSPITTHVYVGLFLNDRWIRCDPSVDSELAKVLKEKTPFAEMTGFNISDEEINNIKGILKRDEFLANIDENLSKPPKHAKGITLEILNSYLRFLREQRQSFKDLSDYQIENIFLDWLSQKNISYFNFIKNLESKSF